MCDNKSPLLLKSAFRRSVRANAFTGRIAVAYKRCLPSPPANAGVPPPYRRFGWSIGSSRRHYCRRRRRQHRRRRRPRRSYHWRRPRGGSSIVIFVILTESYTDTKYTKWSSYLDDASRGTYMESTLVNLREIPYSKMDLSGNRSIFCIKENWSIIIRIIN